MTNRQLAVSLVITVVSLVAIIGLAGAVFARHAMDERWMEN